MRLNLLIILSVFLFAFIFNTGALEFSLTDKSIEAYINGEYNRSFNYQGGLSLLGNIGINNILLLRSGFFYSRTMGITDFRSLVNINSFFFPKLPVIFSISWIYNGLIEYSARTHTLLFLISYNRKRLELAFGVNLRFTSFFKEASFPETIISYSLYYNFINNDTLRMGIGIENFNEFAARNFASASLAVNSTVKINKNWTIKNKIELLQSGLDGFTTNIYGFTWKGGAEFSW